MVWCNKGQEHYNHDISIMCKQNFIAHILSVNKCVYCESYNSISIQGPPLLTWFNSDSSMDTLLHAQWCVGWNYLPIPKLQWCNHWSLGMDKSFHPTLYWACDYLSMPGLKLNYVSKRSPRYHYTSKWFIINAFDWIIEKLKSYQWIAHFSHDGNSQWNQFKRRYTISIRITFERAMYNDNPHLNIDCVT